MNLLKCLLIENDCYKAGAGMRPQGVMVHSTGVNNPNLRRYVQPVAGQEDYETLMAALGRNTNGNHWNRHIDDPNKRKCVHAFIGKLADGSVATVQTLPWETQAWHCAGRANGTHISFEICESDLWDYDHFKETYRQAVDFTAYLCKLYGLDPMAPGVVIGHGEGYKLGVASNRSVSRDPWFGPFGYSMDGFRQDVVDMMGSPADRGPLGGGEANPAPESGSLGDGGGKADSATTKEEENMVTYNTVADIRAGASWAAPTVIKLCKAGALRGGSEAKDAEGYPTDLNLSEDALRILVINDRMGLYGK